MTASARKTGTPARRLAIWVAIVASLAAGAAALRRALEARRLEEPEVPRGAASPAAEEAPLPAPAAPPASSVPTSAPTREVSEDARFLAVLARARELHVAGRDVEASGLWRELLEHAGPDGAAAARLELEGLERAIALDAEERALSRALDAAADAAGREAAVRALAAFWRRNVVERERPALARARERLLAERGRRLAAERLAAVERLEAARTELARRRRLRDAALAPEAWEDRLAAARLATRARPLTLELEEAGTVAPRKKVVVTGLSARGFVLESPDLRAPFERSWWSERPALALEVRAVSRRAAPAERAQDLLADATFAMGLGRGEASRALLAERLRLLPDAPSPDLERVRRARSFATRPTGAGGGRSRFAFALAEDGGASDLVLDSPPGQPPTGTLEARDGKLVLRDRAPRAAARLVHALAVTPGRIHVEAAIDGKDEAPFVALELEHPGGGATRIAVELEDGARLRATIGPPGDPGAARTLAEERLALPRAVLVTIDADPEAGRVSLLLDGKAASLSGAPAISRARTADVVLGKLRGPAATFRRLSVEAPLRRGWLEGLDARFERALTRELGGYGVRSVGLPLATSAEDAVAAGGVPEAAVQALARARALLADGDDRAGERALDEAVREAQPHAAALLLRASWCVERGAFRAHEDLDALLAFLPDCAEALALRALASAREGQREAARADAEAALALRPDLALAWLVRGIVGLAERDRESAGSDSGPLEDLELAGELAPEEPFVAFRAPSEAQVFHRPWGSRAASQRRLTTEHYVVETDVPGSALEAIGEALETGWKLIAKRFPLRGPWRRGSVLVFEERRDYEDWASATPHGAFLARHGGYFDPTYDQLVFFRPTSDAALDETRAVTIHEAAHQYMSRALSPALPDWLNEGLAVELTAECGAPVSEAAGLDRCLLQPAGPDAWRRFLAITYDGFHDVAEDPSNEGCNYARAWVAATLLVEGQGRLEGVLARLLERLWHEPRDKAIAAVLDERVVAELDARFGPRARELRDRWRRGR